MQLPKLTPLQSRFAATFAATSFLLVLYLVLSNPRFAYAADVPSLTHEDRNYPVAIRDAYQGDEEGRAEWALSLDDVDDDDEAQESDIVRRAPQGVIALANNEFQHKDIKIGEVQWFVLPKKVVTGPKAPKTPGLPATLPDPAGASEEDNLHELKRRDDDLSKRSTTVYISLNTCSKPDVISTDLGSVDSFPQLVVYVSQSLQYPGPGEDSSRQESHSADGGYLGTTVDAGGDVYIGVAAPNTTAYSGTYTYDLAASIDAYFHTFNNESSFLYYIDGDINAALLVTDNVTHSAPNSTNYQAWMNITPPYTVFASNFNDTSIAGLHKSYCALNQHAQIKKGSNNVEVGMTNRGLGNKPKEQFYITGLNRSSHYYGFLAMEGNSTKSGNGIVGGGGQVWKAMNFSTKTDDNCAVLFDLPFCSEVAYAVPSNPSLSVAQLKDIYDSHAKALYQNFTKSLQQIQCDAAPADRYSLAVDCTDCAAAYKQWLCAVTIPRCQDFSSNDPWLQPRNAGQAFLNGSTIPADSDLRKNPVTSKSRISLIDDKIKPGPYKEVLPCQNLCYDLVRSCPASLQFSCPTGQWLNSSYGRRDPNGMVTCSYLGAAYFLNSAWNIGDRIWVAMYALVGFWVLIWGLD
ncbi:hypothetical protein VTN02DRAFT_1748 [Thermoascus thermophilus]